MGKTRRLGDLQLAIMQVLWARQEASVADVHAALHPHRGLAFTTIATMLRKMEEKGIIEHRVHGRQFIYRARVSRCNVHRSMVGELVDRLFEGDAAALVGYLITEAEVAPEDLAVLKAMIEARERKSGVDDGQ